MAKVLVTGAGGFLGRHLLRTLGAEHEVVGVDLTPSPEGVESTWVQVSEPTALASTLHAQEPEVVVHGAFVNRRPAHQSAPAYVSDTLTTNLPLFEAATEIGAKLLLVSSSAVYGRAGGREVIDETCPREPASLYGIAKTNQELFATCAAEGSGLQLSVVRLFNLCGPGQRPGMLLPDWVSQAAAIARGAEPRLKVFNLATSRDFVDARDVARAIGLLVADFRPGSTVNVASGRATALTTIIQQLAELCPRAFEVEQTRPAPSSTDVLRQRGSFARLGEGWGWAPQIPFEQSLADLWQEWGG